MNREDLKRLVKAHELAGDAHQRLAQAYGLALESLGAERDHAPKRSVAGAEPTSFKSSKKLVKSSNGSTVVTATFTRAELDERVDELTKLDRKILVPLAQLDRPSSIVTVGIVGEFSHRSSTVDTALAKLRRLGFVEGAKTVLRVTQAGRNALGGYPELPRGYELFEYWKNKLKSPAGKILSALKRTAPASIETVAAHENFSPRSSTVDTAVALLKRMGFIEGPKSSLSLTGEFRRAIEPSISVFDRSSGKQVLVDPRGHTRKDT